jgi:outer membrane protein assembly factor BamE (lipoprotein component of BamABCDE complex)
MNGLLPVLLLSLLVLIQGCSLFIPKETLYLRSAQDRATQEEVRQRLGQPMLTSATQAGEMVWVYEVRQEDPGSRWTSTGLWCDEYVLTFDNQSVLRRWTHKSQFHGGERMPTYCVRGGYQEKS